MLYRNCCLWFADAAPRDDTEKIQGQFFINACLRKGVYRFYYQYSPGIADFIAKHSLVRAVVRICLVPVAGLSWFALNYGIFTTLGAMVFIAMLLIVAMAGLLRKRGIHLAVSC